MHTNTAHPSCPIEALTSRIILTLLACPSLVVLADCKSIVSKSEYPVSVTSNPIGADFVVKRASGLPIANGVAPAAIKPPRSMATPITLDSWFHSREMVGNHLTNRRHRSSEHVFCQISKVKSQIKQPAPLLLRRQQFFFGPAVGPARHKFQPLVDL